VAVVGTGSVGLTAVKWCLDRRFDVIGMDQQDGCGGVWRQGPPGSHSPAYDSLFTNSSKEMIELSDFPFPFEVSGVFPKHEELLRYFNAYKEHFHLNKHIRWNCEVTRVEKQSDGQWRVDARSAKTGEVLPPQYFDAILMCAGKLWDPKLPHWADNKWKNVSVMHSKAYRNTTLFKGEDVLVVGSGNSALDIALELAEDSQVGQVYLSSRRGTTVLPIVKDDDSPFDQHLGTRRFQYVISAHERMKEMLNTIKPINKVFQRYGLLKPVGGLLSRHSPSSNLKQDRKFARMLENGKIQIVAAFEGEELPAGGVKLCDGTELGGVRNIVACTGYEVRLERLLAPELAKAIHFKESYMDPQGMERQSSWLRLYKNIMLPEDPTLFFLGYITSFGNETAIGELQARWATGILAGNVPTPSVAKAVRGAEEVGMFTRIARSSQGFVRYVPYMDDLARDLGCVPDYDKVLKLGLKNFQIVYEVLNGPVIPAHYRLVGQDSIPEQASQVILSRSNALAKL